MKMSEVVISVKLPASTVDEIKHGRGFTNVGEFIRSATIRLLLRMRILPQSFLVDRITGELTKRMTERREVFDPEKEIKMLRKIREDIWREKYAESSS